MAIVVGGVAAASGLAQGIMGAGAARKAASQQSQAIQQGIGYQQGIYNDTRGNFAPYIDAGHNALQSVASFFGLGPAGEQGAQRAYQNFTNTPFYQFPLQQGIQARDASAAARGLTLSGGQEKAISNYGQQYASQNFSNYLQGLSQLAGGGMNATSQLGQIGASVGHDVGQGYQAMGTAQASGTVGAQNALNKGLDFIPNIIGSLTGGLPTSTGGSSSPGLLSGIFGQGSSFGEALGTSQAPSGNSSFTPLFSGSLAGMPEPSTWETAPGFKLGA